MTDGYRAEFLWPHDEGSVEQAGYEFANGKTEAYCKEWWNTLTQRVGHQREQEIVEWLKGEGNVQASKIC